MMRKIIFGIFLTLSLLSTKVYSQIPATIRIRSTEVNDTISFVFSWTAVPGYSTYDLVIFSDPRKFEFEQFRIVTGTAWTIKVPRSLVPDTMRLFASARVSMRPRYGSITYEKPSILAGLMLRPDSVVLEVGQTQQMCAYVVFDDGKVAMRNPEKTFQHCVDIYNSFAEAIKNPSPYQQSVADTVTVTWSIVDEVPMATMVNKSLPIKEIWIIK